MTHHSTALAAHRERDRLRQRTRRQRLRDLGVPMPHQIDNAVSEAVSFAIATAMVGKDGLRAQPKIQTISAAMVFTTALDILVRRWRFDHDRAALALKARLAKRPEFFNPTWVPHYPSCEVSALDMSTTNNDCTPVTSSGHVHRPAQVGNANIEAH